MEYLGNQMSIGGGLDCIPPQIHDWDAKGCYLRTIGAKAVPCEQRKGQPCLTCNDTDQDCQDSQEQVPQDGCYYDFLKCKTRCQSASCHHAGDQEDIPRPYNGYAAETPSLIHRHFTEFIIIFNYFRI